MDALTGLAGARAAGVARTGGQWLVTIVMAVVMGAGPAADSARVAAASDDLSGSWTLKESTGSLPEQAVRVIDGPTATAPDTIRIEQTTTHVRVRRVSQGAALLRVMFLGTGEPDAPTAEGALLTGRAEWRDRTLFSHGTLAVKQGFVKRRVTFEEQWRLGAEGNTVTVVISMKTPLGLKTRTQVYVRVIESNLARQ
ncbi:MAG: hypothetical protein Q8L75_04215 [Acidobacteriota bacterium]|nr:hypothetical protein [Acidobacteriota bacterium]